VLESDQANKVNGIALPRSLSPVIRPRRRRLVGLPKMSYIPPHARNAPAPVATSPEPQSHADWLRSQQSRYTHTVKSAEQIRAECAALSFAELIRRAGPPPTVSACEFVWASGGVMCEDTEADKTMFDGRLADYRRGMGPPPAPLAHRSPSSPVLAYEKWYAASGKRLTEKWYQEHPRAMATKTTKTAPKPAPVVEETKSVRVAEEAGDKSGW
jgi:hypothetical protein